jgi:hypothetical protein
MHLVPKIKKKSATLPRFVRQTKKEQFHKKKNIKSGFTSVLGLVRFYRIGGLERFLVGLLL